MTEPAATIALPPAQAQPELTTLSTTSHGFMELPYDIRFLIYKALMAPKLDLFPGRCPACDSESYYKSTCTHIFRTSKQIYSETLPIFYSMNTVHVRCRHCEQQTFSIPPACRVELHDESTAHLDSYHPYVKSVAITYETSSDIEQMRVFSAEWRRIEQEILTSFKNTEHILLQVPLFHKSCMTVHLVRRSYKSKTERSDGYDGVLAQDSIEECHGLVFRPDFDETCKAVLQLHPQGELKDTVFVVESMRWKPHEDEDGELVLYLGCDKHSPGVTSIEQFFTKHKQDQDSKRHPLIAARQRFSPFSDFPQGCGMKCYMEGNLGDYP